jgi:uncharacterized HAD superfamily protein
MSRAVIGLDFDGTIAETIPLVIDLLNKRYNRNVSILDIKRYWFNDFFDLTHEELSEVFAEILVKNENVELVDPRIPYILNKFRNFADIYLVTASVARVEYLKKWLEDKKIRIDGIENIVNKTEFIKGDVFIDDSPHNAHDIAASGKKVILLTKHHYVYGNEIEHKNIIKASSWEEIEKIVPKLFGVE